MKWVWWKMEATIRYIRYNGRVVRLVLDVGRGGEETGKELIFQV